MKRGRKTATAEGMGRSHSLVATGVARNLSILKSTRFFVFSRLTVALDHQTLCGAQSRTHGNVRETET